MNHRLLVAAAAVLATGALSARVATLMPKVQSINTTGTYFKLDRKVKVNDPTGSQELLRVIGEAGMTSSRKAAAVVDVKLVDSIPGAYDYRLAGYPAEGYTLRVAPDSIIIRVLSPVGTIRAAQTLRQLAQDAGTMLEGVEITDWPAFKLRGLLHDTGRSFIPVDELKRQIDNLAKFKINTFHWHLTENQAWRFESKKYPQLTSAESMVRFPGQYYTQEQCRDLEKYAAERGVTIIPEIDMPGHSKAFERAMGHSMQTPQGVAELQEILEEVAETFPLAPYIHIGADEQQITYPGFLKTMIDKVHSLGREVAVWNPIYGVRVSKDMDIDLVTLWSTAGRLVKGVPNVDLRYNYTNHFDTFSDLAGIYLSNIYYADRGNEEIAGSTSAYWNDRKLADDRQITIQNNLYPNVLATAERAWIGGGDEYIETGGVTLLPGSKRLADFSDWENRFLYHKQNSLPTDEIPYVRQTDIAWNIAGPFDNGGDSSAVFAPEISLDSISWPVTWAIGAAPTLRHTWGPTVPGYFPDAKPGQTAYAYTYIYSPRDTDAAALIEFQNYGRSEIDRAPEQGKWDRKGSRIWLNDKELLPDPWDNTGKKIDHETVQTDENFTGRRPTPIHLNKGWNKVLVKLPYVKADGVRLNKWMFTFVVTDPEGRDALPGLIYSPTRK